MINFFISIFLISASIISYEIILMRLFSIVQWHHFAYMIISLALLGFGASGTAIAIFQRWILRYFKQAFIGCGIIYAYATVGCFLLSQSVPFNPFMIIWDIRQYFYLLTNYLILFVPFFFGASCIGLGLMKFREHINRLYFADLVGAGTGALVIVLAMYFIPPENNLLLVSGLGFSSVLTATISPPLSKGAGGISQLKTNIKNAGIIAFLALSFIGYFGLFRNIKLNISQYKGLSATLNFPDAKILDKKFSPLGLLHVVSSKSIRHAPLSLAYEGTLPQQLALFTDADSMSAITKVEDISFMDYLDYTTSALPYHLLKQLKVLILGAGGGADVLAALYHNARSVDAVELNPQVVELVRDKYGDFTNHIYPPEIPPNSSFTKRGTSDGKAISKKWPVQVVVAEARGFVQSTEERYDLIQVALLDSFSASASGVYALSESYLYTTEAIRQFLRHLREGGILAITRWLKLPPRDTLKLFATIVAALEQTEREKDVGIPFKQLIFIRSWKTGTILVKNGRFTDEEISATKQFCAKRSFDLVYYPGITEAEANQYNLLEQPEYFRSVQTIIFGDRRTFFEDYAFNIKPATDNKPYFFHFFKWKSVPLFLETMRKGWIPFVEWGYIILIATLIQAVFVSIILILSPLFAMTLKEREALADANGQMPAMPDALEESKTRTTNIRIFIYFLSLGLGFMFIEIAFIQKFILLLSYPTYAIAVVLCSFLVFAGFGSLSSKRLRLGYVKPVIIAVLSIIFISLLYLLFLDDLFRLFISQADVVKIPIAIMLIAPLAFFMGMPFPLGLQKVSGTAPNLIPWAWGINGCASVISAVLATCLAISFGFTMVVIIAAVLYGIAAMVYQ
ncbi:TPA: SAM-dependent methyltransferase [Candidatus Poribacteria bacterium]|nr:SAM-dependent methyltransferase [Candidatus Poribacteria bacterium]